jgi:hypothetical protein
MPVHRDGLQDADSVALGVYERDIASYTGYLHRLAEHGTARLDDLRNSFLDIIDRDDDGRISRGPIG